MKRSNSYAHFEIPRNYCNVISFTKTLLLFLSLDSLHSIFRENATSDIRNHRYPNSVRINSNNGFGRGQRSFVRLKLVRKPMLDDVCLMCGSNQLLMIRRRIEMVPGPFWQGY